jgi:urease accessory protein
MHSGSKLLTASLVLVTCFLPGILYAHDGGDVVGGLGSGFSHPFTGLDHVAAMIAVGIWGGQLKQPAIWLLPVTFPLVMAFGAMLGVMGVPLPGIEIGIALSAIILGAMIAFEVVPALWIAAVIVGFFAVFHGHAHGTELPGSVQPLAYGVGFVVGTGILHVTGISIGFLERLKFGRIIVRVLGLIIGLAGVYFLYNSLA